jgi:hypothetical protein
MHCALRPAFVAICLFPLTANGQALTGFTGGTTFATFQADGDTVGWRFSVNRPIIVTHLGFWDGDAGTGTAMINSHPVGMWDTSGTLLASNVVNPTSPFTGQFRYEPIPNLEIPAGTYNLGAFYPGTNPISDGYRTSTTGITMSPGFTMLNTLRDPDGAQTGLVFPSVATAAGGRFGPNILFTEIPEPTGAAVLAGLAGVFAARRRR